MLSLIPERARHPTAARVAELYIIAAKPKHANCGICPDYGCAKLTKLYTLIPPTAKQNLEALRAARQ